MKQEIRKYIAGLVVWFAVANLLYFNNINIVGHDCDKIPGWLPIWIPFTFGIRSLFPYTIEVSTTDLGRFLRGEAEWFCSQNYAFSEIGYCYFVLFPVVIFTGSFFLYKWAFNKGNSVTTSK
jgi:hypothetical protein